MKEIMFKTKTELSKMKHKDLMDALFDDFGVSSLPDTFTRSKLIGFYNKLVENDGDTVFMDAIIADEVKRIEDLNNVDANKSEVMIRPKPESKPRPRKLSISQKRALLRKKLYKLVRVIVKSNDNSVRYTVDDMRDAKQVLAIPWGNGLLGKIETTQIPLGEVTHIHYGALLNLQQAYKTNIYVDKSSGTMVEEKSSADNEFDIKILPALTPQEIEEGKKKQILRESTEAVQ